MTASFTARPPWRAVPAALHQAVQRHVDGNVVDAHDLQGGMSLGPAAVLTLDSGVRVFVKAISKSVNASSFRLYQQEDPSRVEHPAQPVVGVLRRGDPVAGVPVLNAECEVPVLFVAGFREGRDVPHELGPVTIVGVGEVVGSLDNSDEVVGRVVTPGGGEDVVHVRRGPAAHRQEVAEVVQSALEAPPGGHGAHREPAEARDGCASP